MHLYALKTPFDADEFRLLCQYTKTNAKSGRFTYAVVFDDSIHAKFPDNPFTALFGMDESTMRHIIAIFVYNSANGFVEATTYDSNMWDGKPNKMSL